MCYGCAAGRVAYIALGRHAAMRGARARPPVREDARQHEANIRANPELEALVGHELVGHAVLVEDWKAALLVHCRRQLVCEGPQVQHASRAAVEPSKHVQPVLLYLARQVDVEAVAEVRRVVRLAGDPSPRPLTACKVSCRVVSAQHSIDERTGPGQPGCCALSTPSSIRPP